MKPIRSAGFMIPVAGFITGLLLSVIAMVVLPGLIEGNTQVGSGAELILISPEPYEEDLHPASTETATSTNTGEAVRFSTGEHVNVSGTEGQGLRLREYPSLGSRILHLAEEDERYFIVGGPVEADGYQWWFVEHASDAGRRGWGVEQYLEGINE